MSAPSDLRVRAYRPDDLPILIALFTRTVREVAARDYAPEQLLAWAPDQVDLERWERLGRRPTLVAELDGEIAGFSDLEPDGHIDMMFVHAERQGRGVASALMARIEAMAAEQGLARLFTEASLTARPFFERHGFTVLAAQDVEIRGQTLRNFRMEKRLG